MSDGRTERQIIDLAVTSVASLTSCHPVASLLAGDAGELRAPDGTPLDRPELTAQLHLLEDVDGPVSRTGPGWARAYALRAVGGHAGHLVVAADAEPRADELLLLQMLAQQTGLALTTAALHLRQREVAEELRALNTELTDVNDRLAATVFDLELRSKVHETFGAAAASGAGETGIVEALHQLTGLPVAAEDQFGNVRAWAGPDRPEPYPRAPGRQRAALLADTRRSPRPLRDRDRIIALAQSRDEVLGVLALIDPGHRAGDHARLALEHGAVMLCIELSHLRNMAHTELRLRRELVEDLLAGTDDDSALSRSEALGHDLRPPHRVLVVRWPAARTEDVIVRGVEQAVLRVLPTGVLLARRPGCVVIVAPQPEDHDHRSRWTELHRTMAKGLRGTAGSIGVGGLCTTPSAVPKSYAEAQRALYIRVRSSTPAGVTVYDDLGIYRLFTSGGDEVKGYVQEWLGPLLDYDARSSRSELVTTLWQYLECGGNYDSTAQALLIHRSTLRYRLRRIREISGLDLGAVDVRLNLHVATRAWQILQGAP
ncbi:PucR family transcriptional regulator [Pseudonocardia oceani]|uniref:PucR family transcriptional regulator n=1 Tax=Pseudonocardia oceani TaxID=2792013 RepID=UPI001C4A1E3A|nr:helix-turn-helix domain-containing protein [Pseudonocardia oceani]